MRLLDSRNKNNECVKIRRHLGLSQSDFAVLTGVSESMIKKVESGHCRLSDKTHAKISQAAIIDIGVVIHRKVRDYRLKLEKLYGVRD